MPHSRERHGIASLLRKLRFSRVVTLQGPRQCGKSFLVRELLPAALKDFRYVTLDIKAHREQARNAPSSFLAQFPDEVTVAIDEAQKAPDLFDEIKARVDVEVRPGQYLLLGSTEFSREVLVKESLTGRISRQRLFPLNLAECQELDPSPVRWNPVPRIQRKELIRHLDHGGLPGIFSVRSEQEREQKLQEWIEITAYRDLLQFKAVRPDPELALQILEAVANLEFPDASAVRDRVGKDLRRVRTHLKLLEQLFVLHRVPPQRDSTGSGLYFLCDSAVARRLGAGFHRLLQTALVLEKASQAACAAKGGLDTTLQYYRSAKGALVDLILETPKEVELIKIISRESLDVRQLRGLAAAEKKLRQTSPGRRLSKVALYGGTRHQRVEGVSVYPWESMG